MTRWEERYLDFFEKRGLFYFVYNDTIWVKSYNFILTPLKPAKEKVSLLGEEAKYLLNKTNSKIIRVSKGFINEESEWWYIICDTFKDLKEYPSKRRSEINRGLKNCKVERINAEFIAKYGYEVYREAFKRYRNINRNILNEEQFKRYALITNSFEDIIHWWGVFVDGRLVAYSNNSIVDKEVRYAQIKLHPDYLVYYPSYALIYTMNRYYLLQENFEYINDGVRSLFHSTEIQDFLEKKFNFKKVYSKLELFYSPSLSLLIKILYPFRKIVPDSLKYSYVIKSLLKEEEIKRSFDRKK